MKLTVSVNGFTLLFRRVIVGWESKGLHKGCVYTKMFLRAVKRGSSVPRHFRVVRPITVAAKEVSSNEVPDERALNWILYFSHLAEPSQITVIDGTLLETDELDALAKEEEGTNDPRAILSASKRTLTFVNFQLVAHLPKKECRFWRLATWKQNLHVGPSEGIL